MDIAVDAMDDDHIKVPSLKLLLFFGNKQKAAVLLLLKILEVFILKNVERPFIVLLKLEYSLRYTIDGFLTSDIAGLILLLHG